MTDRIVIAETAIFMARMKGRLTEPERESVIETLSDNPKAGDLIPGSGGIRKLRVAAKGKGKSKGIRVIYYFGGLRMPLYLLTVYAKKDQADLSKADLAGFARLTAELKKQWRAL